MPIDDGFIYQPPLDPLDIIFEDADFGIQAARDAGMDAVDVRLL